MGNPIVTMSIQYAVGLVLVLAACAFAEVETRDNGLVIDHYFKPEGECKVVKKGDHLKMHYTGTIDASSKTGTPGKQFDSSRERGPFDVLIGTGQVIKGWDQGIPGLYVASKDKLTTPAELGY